jgi:glyoxylase-like metal-dependent hydrolase (beta-lactamase superfamily II)
MNSFKKIKEGIYALSLPMEDLQTAVFLFCCDGGNLLYDTANGASDIDEILLPALAELGLTLTDLDACVLSHSHGDHAGGAPRLQELRPDLPIYAYEKQNVKDTAIFFSCLELMHLPGHARDCVGIFDRRSQTLVCADALQQRGIGRYGLNLETASGYLQTIERIVARAPRAIVASHDYLPLGACAEGAKVQTLLNQCRADLTEVAAFVKANEGDAATLTQLFRCAHPDWPLLSQYTVQTLLDE